MSTIQISPTAIWKDLVNPSLDEVNAVIERFGFHELDREAILEENQYARIDTYDDYLFLVLHFPKYEPMTERYIHNEFNIFISKTYLLSFRYYNNSNVRDLRTEYEKKVWEDTNTSTGFLLYELLESMLDKVMRMLEQFGKDLRSLEHTLFTGEGSRVIQSIMVKKRNIITLKHMMKPQIAVLKMLETRMNTLFDGEIELYFENLEDKLDKIFSEIELLQENIDSMEDTLKSLFEFKTNTTMKYFTLFSAIMLPLTVVTGFFGMNIKQATFENWIIGIALFCTFFLISAVMYYLFRVKKI